MSIIEMKVTTELIPDVETSLCGEADHQTCWTASSAAVANSAAAAAAAADDNDGAGAGAGGLIERSADDVTSLDTAHVSRCDCQLG